MSQLLSSKLLPPYSGSKLIERPRLMELFPSKESNSATIIAAPAGYGKTVLITQFAQKIKEPLLWYQLDDYDNDPAVFLQYFVAGIQQYSPKFGANILALVAQGNLASHLRLLVMAIVNGLETHTQGGFVIALDDYHLINEPVIHGFVQELLHHLPSGIQLIIASRTTPPLSLSRLILLEKARVIGPAELRFTRQEINTFWSQNYDKISDASIDLLERKTAGWPAALRLIGTSSSVLEENLLKSDGQEIYDYLATEVLGQQPEEVRSFLLSTSVLEELTPSFCDLLLNRTDSLQILEYLEKCHLFLIPLSGEKKAYRYHHLFRDFLRDHLGSNRSALLHRTGLLYLENGEPEIAVEYLFAANSHNDLPTTVKQASSQAFIRGNWQTVARWLDRLPEDFLETDPWLALYKAKVEVYRGRLDEAEPWSNKVTALFAAAKDQTGLAESQLIQARIFRCRGQYKKSLGILDQIKIVSDKAAPRFDISLEKSLCMLMSGQINEAEITLTTALAAAKQHNDKYGMAYLGEALGHVYYSKGDYSQALQIYQNAATISPDQSLPNYYMQDAISIIYHDWGEWDLALDYAKRNVAIKENFGLVESLPSAYIQLAGLYSDHEQWQLAEEYFNRAITILRTNNGERHSLVLNLMFLAECLVLQGRWTEAKIKAKEALAEAQPLSGLALAICRTVGAMVFLLAGDRREGNEILSAAIKEDERMLFKKGLCYAYAFKAWYHLSEDEPEAAREYVGKCLALVAQLNYQQLFLGRYTMLQPLLKLGLETGAEVTFVQRLLVRLGNRALPILADLTMQNAPEVRLRTITPLTEIGDQEAKKIIRRLMNDTDAEVRRTARLAAKRLSPTESRANSSSADSLSLHIVSLGPFNAYITEADNNVIVWRTTKTRDLLAYFIHHQEPLSKEKILKDLWPDISPESAAAIFHTTLYYLRHSLSNIGYKNFIRYNGKRYQVLPETFTSEARQFQELLAAACRVETTPEKAAALLEKAVALYHGDYLEDIDYHWVIPCRENLKHACIDARMRLVRHYLKMRDYLRALSHLNIIEEFDPFLEEAHALFMTVYANQGNRLAVEKHFQKVATIFKKELGLPTPPLIHDLYDKLSTQDNRHS